MTKVLVSGYIGFNNFGDEAIFLALCSHLVNLNCKVEALSASDSYGIKTYNYKNPFAIIYAISKCDILISGGGSLLQNKTSNFSLLYYLFIILLAKIFFKKVLIFAQGIEPLKGKFFESLVFAVLRLCDYITVRDVNSQKFLQKHNIDSKLSCDPAYALFQNIKINNDKDGLIIQLRNIEGIKKSFTSDLAALISKYYRGRIVVLALQREYDEKVCLEFIEKLNQNGMEGEYISHQKVLKTIEIINSSQFVISTRLHGIMCAHAMGAQTFAISYDDKIKTLTDELNMESIDIYNYNYDELDKKISEFFSEYRHTNKYRKFEWEVFDKAILKENL